MTQQLKEKYLNLKNERREKQIKKEVDADVRNRIKANARSLLGMVAVMDGEELDESFMLLDQQLQELLDRVAPQ